MRKTKHRISSVFLSLCMIISCMTGISFTAAAGDDPAIIVSLGDSYSSGEGIEPFFGQDKEKADKVKDADWVAHRSQKAWSGQLIAGGKKMTRGTNWFFAAASGAKTKDITGNQSISYNKGTEALKGSMELAPQLDIFNGLELTDNDFVTITIGGNDVGFGDIMTCAVLEALKADDPVTAAGLIYFMPENYQALAKKTVAELIADIKAHFNDEDGIRSKIKAAYKSIAEKTGDATIIVAGYPKLLSSDGFNMNLLGKEFPVSKTLCNTINTDGVSWLNTQLANIVKECADEGLKIRFVDVQDAFAGHEAYTQNEYINGLIALPQGEEIDDTYIISNYSMHPNEKGAAAYAAAVQAKLAECEGDRYKFTITFDTDGGTKIAPITQNFGTPVTKPADPTKTGYTFAGWDKEIPETMPEENITIKAIWTKNVKSISVVIPQTLPVLIVGKPLDLTGYTLKVTYADKTTETIDLTVGMVSGYNTDKAGKQKLTAAYGGKTATFNVTVLQDPDKMPIVVNGAGYESLTAAFKTQKTGDLDIMIKTSITEKNLTIPKTVNSAKITTAPDAVLTLSTPTITANCNLTLDVAAAAGKATAKTITIKAAADKKIVIKRFETAVPITLSGSKTSAFTLGTGSEIRLAGAAGVNVEIAEGTTASIDGGKFAPTSLTGAGKLNVYGACTVTLANVINADITLNKYTGKNTTSELQKLTLGTVGNISLTVNEPDGNPADISGQTIAKLLNQDTAGDIGNRVTIVNTSGGKALAAVQYKKELRAENPDALTVEGLGNFSSLEKAFEAMNNPSANYAITLNEDLTVNKLTLPKQIAGLTIDGGGHTLTVVGNTVSLNTPTVLKNITVTAVKLNSKTKTYEPAAWTLKNSKKLTADDTVNLVNCSKK